MAATEKFDMIPVREKKSFDPQPWDGTEKVLPGKRADGGYFLKNETGPKFVVGGTVIRPLATVKETEGRFSVYSVETSSHHAAKGLKQALSFAETHHAVQTAEGIMELTIGGKSVACGVGETVFIPAGTAWKFEAKSLFAKAYVFANGSGIGEVLTSVGKDYTFAVSPEVADVESWDESKVKELEGSLGFTIA
jgi:mannose-6-phosphate isomerase-like protein (cupin superfamily)